MTPIKKFTDKENILDRAFLVKDKVKGIGKNGKAFLSLLVGDNTGHIDARLWDNVEATSELFEAGDIVVIKGAVQVYLNRKQIVIHKLDRPDQSQYNKEDYFIKELAIDTRALFAELNQLVQTVKSSFIKQLLTDTINDESIKELIIKAPAAKSIHHAKKGGLLEHVVSICKLMQFIGSHYTELNTDLLLFGAIYHDIGKIWELEILNDQIQYSHKGRLLGHMQLGCELVDKKSQRILGFPDDLKDILKHIILSHHGKLEYGSPVRPYIPEAFMVASIDELDSKMDTMSKFIKDERETGENWSRYNEHFDRYFYLESLKGKWL
jgi:3'-5' exoribonuclease